MHKTRLECLLFFFASLARSVEQITGINRLPACGWSSLHFDSDAWEAAITLCNSHGKVRTYVWHTLLCRGTWRCELVTRAVNCRFTLQCVILLLRSKSLMQCIRTKCNVYICAVAVLLLYIAYKNPRFFSFTVFCYAQKYPWRPTWHAVPIVIVNWESVVWKCQTLSIPVTPCFNLITAVTLHKRNDQFLLIHMYTQVEMNTMKSPSSPC